MSMSLDEKLVVILGWTSGNGLATAKAAQRDGAVVVIASSRQQRVDSATASLESGAEGRIVDLSDGAQVKARSRNGPLRWWEPSAARARVR